MTASATVDTSIDEYLRRRLMPVEGAIPRLAGFELYGNSIPAEKAGGDLFEYINFQQRYNIAARIARARACSTKYLEPLPDGARPRNGVDVHVRWLQSKPGFKSPSAEAYREAKSSEQLRIAENLESLYFMAGVLLVDAQGHGILAAKIASTVHDTFHTAMLSELDANGEPTPELFETVNVRLAQSVSARNVLGLGTDYSSRELATMVYGEMHPGGIFRFVNFGHPPPLVFSAEFGKFMKIDDGSVAHFPALGLEVPEDHPDRSKYFSIDRRQSHINSSDLESIQLMNRGDIIFLYTDGVYDGTDECERKKIEQIIERHKQEPARNICTALLDHAVRRDDRLKEMGQHDRIDDKTVFIIKSV
jgi:serine phosphatase RsbU (regulator of sigma subunit)